MRLEIDFSDFLTVNSVIILNNIFRYYLQCQFYTELKNV